MKAAYWLVDVTFPDGGGRVDAFYVTDGRDRLPTFERGAVVREVRAVVAYDQRTGPGGDSPAGEPAAPSGR